MWGKSAAMKMELSKDVGAYVKIGLGAFNGWKRAPVQMPKWQEPLSLYIKECYLLFPLEHLPLGRYISTEITNEDWNAEKIGKQIIANLMIECGIASVWLRPFSIDLLQG